MTCAEGDATRRRLVDVLQELELAVPTSRAAEVFERYTAADYVFTSPAGAVVSRADVLKGFRDRTTGFTSYRMNDIDVRYYRDFAIVRGRAEGEGVNPGGERFSGDYRFTSVWSLLDGDWRLLTWHATAVASDDDTTTADATA